MLLDISDRKRRGAEYRAAARARPSGEQYLRRDPCHHAAKPAHGAAAASFCRKIDWRLATLGAECKIDLAIEQRKSAKASARELKVPSPRARPLAAQLNTLSFPTFTTVDPLLDLIKRGGA